MKIRFITLAALVAVIPACGLLASCSAVSSAITGQPTPATAVQRSGHDNATPVLVSSADLALAEQAPAGTVHGLYNISYLAETARAIVIEAVK